MSVVLMLAMLFLFSTHNNARESNKTHSYVKYSENGQQNTNVVYTVSNAVKATISLIGN